MGEQGRSHFTHSFICLFGCGKSVTAMQNALAHHLGNVLACWPMNGDSTKPCGRDHARSTHVFGVLLDRERSKVGRLHAGVIEADVIDYTFIWNGANP